MKRNHEQLKRLVREIVLARRDDDLVTLNQAIAEAGTAIGLLDNTPPPSEPRSCSFEQNESTNVVSNSSVLQSSGNVFDEDVHQHSLANPRSGRFSPRLDYGLWIDQDRFIKIFEPPLDIRPYIGPGRHTVAGYITWACLHYGYACLQEAMTTLTYVGQDVKGDLVRSLPPGSASRQAFDLSLRHSRHLHDIAFITALVKARIDFHDLGYTQSNTRGSDEISRQTLEGRVKADLRNRGVRMDQWWSALDIEAHLRTRIGVLKFSTLQRALVNEQAMETQLIMPLAQSLAHRAVCFGEGPRWNTIDVTALVSAWVSHVTTAEM